MVMSEFIGHEVGNGNGHKPNNMSSISGNQGVEG